MTEFGSGRCEEACIAYLESIENYRCYIEVLRGDERNEDACPE